ncbi:MAG: RsbRD N-terminal domain-containing protein [Pseudomonadota bacterium]
MSLENLVTDRKSAILKRWFELTIETYPEETVRFLKSKKNRFANPVGHILSKEIEPILDGLFQKGDLNTLLPFLDNIIRIRAIQEFSPSQAIAFVFLLKQVIREEMEPEIRESHIGRDLLELESRIDELGLLSFDIFMKCREKIYDLKANELNNRTVRLLKRAKLVIEDPSEMPPTIV